jgi:AcrR family transcriptional regulator
MTDTQDPRLIATRAQALDAALAILQADGVLAVTHGSVGKATGISRSTLYRHWPKIELLRNDAFKRAASSAKVTPKTDGPLRVDLTWLLSILVSALSDTPWGQIAPQVIAAASTDPQARLVIGEFMEDRIVSVAAIFKAAEGRGELKSNVQVRTLVELAIAGPYFRKLVLGEPLDPDWLETHVEMICRLAENPSPD